MDSKKFKLRNGVEVPFIGFGTGVIKRYSRKPYVFIRGRIRPVLNAVKHASAKGLYQILQQDFFMGKVIDTAISEGYTLLDSGRIYGYSEVEYGKAIVRNNLPREDIFVTTKVSDMDLYRDGSPNDVAGNLQLSLKYLQLDFVDAYFDVRIKIEQVKMRISHSPNRGIIETGGISPWQTILTSNLSWMQSSTTRNMRSLG